MFKYISDILGKLSTGQRLTALIVLLVSIVIITIGPKIASILSQDNEELNDKICRQRNEISELNKTVSDLSSQITNGQKSCTDRFVARENEILDMISNIEREAQKVNTRLVAPDRMVIRDTVSLDANMMAKPQRLESAERVTGTSPELMRMIRMYKCNIQKNAGSGSDK